MTAKQTQDRFTELPDPDLWSGTQEGRLPQQLHQSSECGVPGRRFRVSRIRSPWALEASRLEESTSGRGRGLGEGAASRGGPA